MKIRIFEQAKALGFDTAGITAPAFAKQHAQSLTAFLTHGHHGDMGWMDNPRRFDPAQLWPEAKSVIVVGHNYGPQEDPLLALEQKDKGAISVYAHGRDYHKVMKSKLKALAGMIYKEFGGEAKIFVDTAPLMEKPLAAQTRIGWQGKHTCLVSREFGSWLFLGFIFTTLELEPDQPEENHCGSCSRCLDICPTNAFPKPYTLDATRCIAYLTIEHKGQIAKEFRKAMGNRIYGCDDCLAVCPWNKFAQASREESYRMQESLSRYTLEQLAMLDDSAFRALFAGSPIKRTGRDRFVRNVLIAIGNSGDETLLPAVYHLLKDPSPLVRGAAVWALSELAPKAWLDLAENSLKVEGDPQVRSEWQK